MNTNFSVSLEDETERSKHSKDASEHFATLLQGSPGARALNISQSDSKDGKKKEFGEYLSIINIIFVLNQYYIILSCH